MEIIKNRISQNMMINNQLLTTSCNNFHLLQVYPHSDMGWILSGFLSNGTMKVGKELFWYDYDKILVTINSIYINNNPVQEIQGPSTCTVTLKKINKITNKPRFGFLSNINYSEIKRVKLIWLYFNDAKILNEKDITIYVKNQMITLKKVNKNYIMVYPKYSYHVTNKMFIYEKDNNLAFGKINVLLHS
jgi:selenocysteine-specific translation elongation factor